MITVQSIVNATLEKAWAFWTQPEHVIQWNNASDDWHCPKASNDLKVGGKFIYTMAAKDGSMSFDFEGEYSKVDDFSLIEYHIIDGRKVIIQFEKTDEGVLITESFDPENMHPEEYQQQGWQAILNNFKNLPKTINMATQQVWLNLPVKNALKSKDFFTHLGFTFLEERTTEHSACMLLGSTNFVVMLFAEAMFQNFIQHEITDTSKSSEVLISIDAESREEVDELARKAKEAGGILFGEPAENQGWMYGCGFCDLDGHRWNVLYMDFSKMPH